MRGRIEREHRPRNYRTNDFHLFGKDIQIGGMARPDNNANQDMAMQYLKQNESVDLLIGLKEQSYATLANSNGLDYFHLPINDFTKAPVATYEALYQKIKEATEQGRKVTIHCGAGDGRTGTALASLKLRQIMIEAALRDPSILDEPPRRGATTPLPASGISDASCTPFVKTAVELTRSGRNVEHETDHSGSHSVETTTDLEALMDYEIYLHNEIKKELGIDQTLGHDEPLPMTESINIDSIETYQEPGTSTTDPINHSEEKTVIEDNKNCSYAVHLFKSILGSIYNNNQASEESDKENKENNEDKPSI